jgi:DNA recombination protein RmuC
MALLELAFAVLAVCVLAGVALLAYLLAGIVRRADGQATELAQLRGQLALGGQSQESAVRALQDRLAETRGVLEALQAALAARHQVDEEARRSLRRLEAVIAGSHSRGAAGENVLEEAFRSLPPDMLRRNVWVNGKVVEFGFRLPGGKILPIDSKWAAGPALEELALGELSPTRRAQLVAAVEREVERRVREVAQYIDPATTTPLAVAAVPDGAYTVCRTAFAEAYRRHVAIVAYSMVLPYLLLLYHLHLQFARGVDAERLEASLMEIGRQLELLDSTLENRLQRALTMLGNAYQEGKQVVSRIQASLQGIRPLEPALEEPLSALTGEDGQTTST